MTVSTTFKYFIVVATNAFSSSALRKNCTGLYGRLFRYTFRPVPILPIQQA